MKARNTDDERRKPVKMMRRNEYPNHEASVEGCALLSLLRYTCSDFTLDPCELFQLRCKDIFLGNSCFESNISIII